MKKRTITFLMSSLLFTGCSQNSNNVIIHNDSNSENSDELTVELSNETVKLYIQSVWFYGGNLNPANYLDIKNNGQKEITSDRALESYYDKIERAKDNNEITFVDGDILGHIDFEEQKIVLFSTIRENMVSYFDIDEKQVNKNNINVTLLETVEEDYEPMYCSVGLVFAVVPKNATANINASYKNNELPTTVKKPIVYFYPEDEMDLTVKYVNEEKLLTTYPKYKNGWNIHLNKDGTFVADDSGREYYALYFDELPNYKCEFNEGFYVTKDNAISLLEEKMDYIGYTNREVDEFMMYWLPILENNGRSIVYFEQTEERNIECPLEFSINPDTLIRTIIHIKKVEEEVNIPEQQLNHYDRNGFTVTEWGGIEH